MYSLGHLAAAKLVAAAAVAAAAVSAAAAAPPPPTAAQRASAAAAAAGARGMLLLQQQLLRQCMLRRWAWSGQRSLVQKLDLQDLQDLTRYATQKSSSDDDSSRGSAALAGMASDLRYACSRSQGSSGQPAALLEGVQLLVLPDLRTLLLECFSIPEELVAQLLQQGQQQHGAAASSRQQPVRLSYLKELLAGLGKLSTADAAFVASLMLHAVRLLQPAETLPLDLQLQQLLSLLQQQLFAAVAYSTAMQQLEGAGPLLPAGASDADVAASWGPVKQAGGKGNSSGSSKGGADVAPEWVPLLPEARAVLLAALVHEQQGSPLQGISHAVQLLSQAAGQARAAWVQQQQQQQQPSQPQGKAGKQQKQQQGKASGSKQAAKTTSSSTSSELAGADYTQLLTLPVLQALLAACVDAVTDEQGEVADEAAAAAAGNAVADLMSLLLGRSLLQLLDQRQQQQQQGPAPSSLPALVLPDAQAWSLLVRLLGAAGRYSWVAGLVSAATRGQLPLAECDTAAAAAAAAPAAAVPRGWSAGDLQCVLAAAAGVWLSARCPGLVLAMLDALAAAGGSSLDNAQLPWAVIEATRGEGDVLYDGLAARLADEEDIFEALPQLAGQHTQQQEAAAAAAAGKNGCSWYRAGRPHVAA
uniref:Uncharacterized protein n=1 Tax=Tetradesmus obliquus TaxID=3088 RepID=A0A383W2K9_TETOB|eukprot:jgi/Sobl393_1/4996/SZX76629.1